MLAEMRNDMDRNEWQDWDARCPRKEDSTNNPYYNQPTHSPYKGQGFAVACAVCGILSTILMSVIAAPFICAAFSYLFAELSYRKGKRRHHLAIYGLMGSAFGVGSGVFALINLFSQ